ncbi:MAG TPA: glycosyltransferase family 4 protein [Candidatus Limnocylindrales bacterium]|nr:glycosyltransferase family 4 protein [Candidatus Limnocylindrales bacterium]
MIATSGRAPVAMLTHSYYEEDPRVRREAEALVAGGRPVDVFALRQPGDARDGVVAGVTVHRLDVQRHQGAGLATYLREYLSFLGRAGIAATRAHRRRSYGLVQVHTLPDFLAAAGLPLRLRGVPLVLDLHEAMPEFFRARFPRAANPVAYRLLRIQERISIGMASQVLTVNDALAARLLALGVPAAKVTVIANSPVLTLFDPSVAPERAFAADGVVRLVYAGALSPTYELDVALAALARIAELRPNQPIHLDVYGRDFGEEPLATLAERLGVGEHVTFHGRVPLEDVPAAIAAADIGLAPTRRNPFTDLSLSTKVFEYAAMRKPVVASRLPLIESTFGVDAVATYEPGDPDSLARAVLALVDDAPAREARVARTAAIVSDHSWEREAERYRALIDRLAARHDGHARSAARLQPDAERGDSAAE